MRTKAVYVVVSDNNDVYFEQAWVSAWSLKHYNPDMDVYCIVDQDTFDNIFSCYRQNASEVIDRFVKVDVPAKYSKIERSRYLKTSVRKYIDGDFLFIDADTIICDTLEEIDSFQYPMMMVLDSHRLFEDKKGITSKNIIIRKVFNRIYDLDHFYNSGVIFVKDTKESHSFFEEWHDNWIFSCSKDVITDQQSLGITVMNNNIIKELEGNYNYQINSSAKYLHSAKIIHFFNILKTDITYISPFNGDVPYIYLKEKQEIEVDLKRLILNCKDEILSPSRIITGSKVEIYSSDSFSFLSHLYKNYPNLYLLFNRIAKLLLKVAKAK